MNTLMERIMKENEKKRHAFHGASKYILDEELAKIVTSPSPSRCRFFSGEPGTGKTMLAHAIAENLGLL